MALACCPDTLLKVRRRCDQRFEAGDLTTFFGGLEAKIGSPNPKVRQAMDAEHTQASDSQLEFRTSNYEVTTTPEVEWRFVVSPERDNFAWPQEEKLRDEPDKMRQPMPIAELQRLLDGVD
jgi:hypothetical protein